MSNIPKLGNYRASEEIMLKLMSFVAVDDGGKELRLTTEDLVNTHVPEWEMLGRLEIAMLNYNCPFFCSSIPNFLAGVMQEHISKISEILATASTAVAPKNGQPSVN